MELNELFSETQVETLADNVIKKIIEDFTKNLQDIYYQEIQNYLHEHYQNFKDNLEDKLIKQIVGKFISEPESSKYTVLRKKLFNENKEFLIKVLTRDYIENEMKNIFLFYTDNSWPYHQKWLDSSIRCINQNWDKFKDNEYIKETLFYEIQNLNSIISDLRSKINELEN